MVEVAQAVPEEQTNNNVVEQNEVEQNGRGAGAGAVQEIINNIGSDSEEKMKIFAEIEELAKRLFNEKEQHPVKKTKANGNLEVRMKWEGDKMMCIGEMKRIEGIVPDDYREFLINWADHLREVNPIVVESEVLEATETYKTARFVAKLPFPLWNRLMITSWVWKECTETGGLILLTTGRGCDQWIDKVHDAASQKKYVLASVFVSSWWIKPIKNEAGEVIGTNMQYLNSSNAGGNIPEFLQNKKGPGVALDAM